MLLQPVDGFFGNAVIKVSFCKANVANVLSTNYSMYNKFPVARTSCFQIGKR
jgi:hypothetical protein